MAEQIKIMLVEDHELTRKGILYGINKASNLTIVGEAIDGQDAIDQFDKTKPDIILMDIALPIINGIDATKIIKEKCKNTKIIMLTSYSDKEKVFAAFSAGANAYCMKDIKVDTLNNVIEMIYDGAIWLDPQIASMILEFLPHLSNHLVSQVKDRKNKLELNIELTSREKDILIQIADGLNNKDIADKLCLSIYTVKNHVSSIINKLAVDDRTQAAILAIKKGLI